MAGDHAGLGGFLGVIGSWFEATNGQIELDQQFCIGDRRVGRRVGARHAGPQRQDPRVAQRLRVPVRGRSDRRDVDVPRRAARGRPRRSSPDRGRRWARLGDVVRAIEDARAACDDHRWGDAFRLLSERRARARSTSTISTGSRPRPYLTGHDEDGFAYWVRAHQVCVDDGALHRAAYFGMRARPGARVQGRPRPLPRLGRPHRPPPRRRGHRLRRAGLPRIRAGDDAALRGRRHRRRARPLRPGRQDRRPLRPSRARHPRADRRGPHADLPRRDRRGDGAARRGHGVDRSPRAVTARDRRRVLHGDRRVRGALRPRPVPSVDRVVRPLVRHATGARALPRPLLPAPRRGARSCSGRGPRRSSKPDTPAIGSPHPSTRPRSAAPA